MFFYSERGLYVNVYEEVVMGRGDHEYGSYCRLFNRVGSDVVWVVI